MLLESTPFRLGDQRLAVDGQPVSSRADLRQRLLELPAPWGVQVQRHRRREFVVVGP